MPLLHTLDANFLPHSSLAKSLVKLSLDLGLVSLASLLDFLSSTNALQDLSIYVFLMADGIEQEVPDHNPVLLPELVKLCFRAWEGSMRSASIVAQKIRTSSLQTLALHGMEDRIEEFRGMQTTSGGSCQGILQSNPSFTELDLSLFTSIDLRHIPPQVEVLILNFSHVLYVHSFFKCSGAVRSHRIRLILFLGEGNSSLKDCVYHIRDVLLRSGLNAVQIEFRNCWRFRNGSFDLKDVHRAYISNDDLD
ncbi:hypothetical protein ACEPAG_9505 [Sanghuangporus baumii]